MNDPEQPGGANGYGKLFKNVLFTLLFLSNISFFRRSSYGTNSMSGCLHSLSIINKYIYLCVCMYTLYMSGYPETPPSTKRWILMDLATNPRIQLSRFSLLSASYDWLDIV